MKEITIVDTAKAILENPDEVFCFSSSDFEKHQANLKMLAYLVIVPIVEGEYLVQKEIIRNFVKNDGKTNNQISTEKALKNSENANKISVISIVLSIISICVAYISLKH